MYVVYITEPSILKALDLFRKGIETLM